MVLASLSVSQRRKVVHVELLVRRQTHQSPARSWATRKLGASERIPGVACGSLCCASCWLVMVIPLWRRVCKTLWAMGCDRVKRFRGHA